MKYIRTTVVLTALLLVAVYTSCSSNNNEEPEDEILSVWQPPPPPEPDWADNDMTVTVGNYESGAGMLSAMREHKNTFSVQRILKATLLHEDFPMSRRKYSIKVSVFRLKELGITEPVNVAQIRKQCRKMGYRTMTLEESVELRLQITDWPKENARWNTFNTLLNKEHAKLVTFGGAEKLIDIYHKYDDFTNQGIIFGMSFQVRDEDDFFNPEAKIGIQLAVVTEEISQ